MVLVIGHRGAAAHAPENTLASFRKAMELGADMVELDVQLTSDGELVVIHDDTLERTTDGWGPVSSRSLSDLRGLDAGGGERVPTLGEVLGLVGTGCGLDIELKGKGTGGPTARLLRVALEDGPLTRATLLVTSFDPLELKEFAEVLPDVSRGILLEGDPEGATEVARFLGADIVGPDHRFTTLAFVRECLTSGLKVFPWTVNDVIRARELIAWGAGAIITDRPELKHELPERTGGI